MSDAVDTSTGKTAWRIQTPFKALSGMTVAGDLLFYGRSSGRFDPVNARTGKTLWSYAPNMKTVGGANAPPAVYVRTGREYVVMVFGGNFRQRKDYRTATSLLGDAVIAFGLPQAGNAKPSVETAHPQLVKTGAPQMFAPAKAPSPGAQVVNLQVHDLQMFPHQFSVKAGQKIALHSTNTGIIPITLVVNLPSGPIAEKGGVDPGKSIYFQFMAPATPGNYKIAGVGDSEFKGLTGIMHVTA